MIIVLIAFTPMQTISIIPLSKECLVLNLGFLSILTLILLIHLILEILTAHNLRLIKVLLLMLHQ